MTAIAYAHNPGYASKYVFNHDIMNCTADGVVGNHLYSGRALGMTQESDIIQINSELESLWPYITSHYDRIGLSHTKEVSWFLNLNQLGAHIGYKPSVFFYGPDEYKNWGDFDWYNTVNFINSKNNFMALAKELGVDVPQTQCFDSVKDIDMAVINNTTFPCYLKAAISVSGVGIYRCTNKSELQINLAKFDESVPVQIQEEVITDTFLNMQYMIVDGELTRLATSEQILDGFVHQGNRVPACYTPWASVDKMAHWLKEQGMQGVFAFDVAVVKTDNGMRFPAIECNPRFNGASYPTMIALKLGISEWSSITYSTKHRHLKDIDLTDIEYNSKTKEGAILVNWGTVFEGRLMILLAGSRDYQEALDIELRARL